MYFTLSYILFRSDSIEIGITAHIIRDYVRSHVNLIVLYRCSREELETWSRGQNPKHHHGHEGTDENQGEEPTRGVRVDSGDVSAHEGRLHHPAEDSQTGRAGGDVQVVCQNHHNG